MEAEDLVIGQKVRPLQRTIRTGVEKADHSIAWRSAKMHEQPFLYVGKIRTDLPDGIPRVLCTEHDPDKDPDAIQEGDWFHDVDLVPAE